MKGQLRELLTNYGEIRILCLDFSYPRKNGKGHEDWDSENLLKMVRELLPGILVNDRLDLNDMPGGLDFTTPEQFKVTKWPEKNGKQILWETCQTFSGSWGYHCDENIWKSTAQLLQLLIESLSKGDNLLMNVGPTARGVFDSLANDRLEAMGEWMKYNSRSIYGCTQALSSFIAPERSLRYSPTPSSVLVQILFSKRQLPSRSTTPYLVNVPPMSMPITTSFINPLLYNGFNNIGYLCFF